ncbi:phage-related hypothetical protein [plant metagenome]|uniref:Uncharacterized protein n=2 Tax=plant metagenome TaxID=1297885 RepID=A0A484XQG7_9ZZZZ
MMLLAAGYQESKFRERLQRRGGPARGFWQFELGTQERGGGVWGVYKHDSSRYWLDQLCQARGCPFQPRDIYTRIAEDDVLAAGLARLLLFTDRQRLPALGDMQGAWALYRYRTWCPGKPRPEEWPDSYGLAFDYVQGVA